MGKNDGSPLWRVLEGDVQPGKLLCGQKTVFPVALAHTAGKAVCPAVGVQHQKQHAAIGKRVKPPAVGVAPKAGEDIPVQRVDIVVAQYKMAGQAWLPQRGRGGFAFVGRVRPALDQIALANGKGNLGVLEKFSAPANFF